LLSGAGLLRNDLACRLDLVPPVAAHPASMLDSGVRDQGFHCDFVIDKSSTAPLCALCCMLLATELLQDHRASVPDPDILISPQSAWMLASTAQWSVFLTLNRWQRQCVAWARLRLSQACATANP
jgi:hypothetical protein